MAIKRVKQGRWSRQAHLAKAGLLAGVGWATGQLRTLSVPADERDAAREALVRNQAESWVREIGELKGSIVKIGQILATYGDYCLPPPLAQALHLLEADTAPLAWPLIDHAVSDNLGARKDELIIEPVPLAAASLSQVHRARSKGDLQALCLKVLYPSITETLDSDLGVLDVGIRWWLADDDKARFSEWLDVIAGVLREELDLVKEASKLRRWRSMLAEDPRYAVPYVFQEFSGSGVLCMSYEAGFTLHDPAVQQLSQERRNHLAASMLELLLKEVLVWGEMQTDPHPGNYRIRLDESRGDCLVLLDFGSVRVIGPSLLLPLRKMLLSAYAMDHAGLLQAMVQAGILSGDAPEDVQQAFASVLGGLIEPLNYKQKLATDPDGVPEYAVDDQGRYCWAAARLPRRMAKQAVQSAFSKHFRFPGADFLLLSRKLAGVYAFLAALDARLDASEIFDKVCREMPVSEI